MTTKAPQPQQEYPADSIEKIIYKAVSEIPAQEPNDLNRLAYNVWAYTVDRKGTLEEVIKYSYPRIHIPLSEACEIIRKKLAEHGIKIN